MDTEYLIPGSKECVSFACGSKKTHGELYAIAWNIIHLVPQNSQETAEGPSGASLTGPLAVSKALKCTLLGEAVGASATCI